MIDFASKIRDGVLNIKDCSAEDIENLLALSESNPNITRSILHLNLSGGCIGDAEVNRIAESKAFKLITLNLSYNNNITHLTCWSISASDNFGDLVEVDLSQTNIGDKGVKALFCSETLTSLRSLDLARNEGSEEKITDKGLKYIADSPMYNNLEKLYLENNDEITGEGIQCIIRSEYLTGLKEINFDESNVSAEIMMEVVKWSVDNNIHITSDKNIVELLLGIYNAAHGDDQSNLTSLISKLDDVDCGEKYVQYFREHQDEYPFNRQVLENQEGALEDFEDSSYVQKWVDNVFSELVNQQDVDLQGMTQNDMES